METAPRLLIISHDAVGARMAGPGIRAWEMARALAVQQPVTLIAPASIDYEPAGFVVGSYTWGNAASLEPWLRDAGVVLANGHVLAAHPELGHLACPLALDLYDPVALENLELFRNAEPAARAARMADDRALLARQLAVADFIACATERQRDLYIGALLALGRVTPERTDADPQLRSLIDVVPFGLPSEPPLKRGPGVRNVLPGIGERDTLVIWSGGIWDWLDPLTLVEAIAIARARRPDVRAVFLAGRHPGGAMPMRAPDAARARAASLGLLGTSVFFYDEWVPYEQRASFLLEADLAISLHHAHLETAYAAVRSRFLDHLWAGLPSVVSAGDAAADLVQRHRLGRVVAPGDAMAVAEAIVYLLDDEAERAACAHRARALAREFTWERVVRPLAAFCRRPHMTREPIAEPVRATSGATLPGYRDSLSRLHELWRVTPGDLGSAMPLLGAAKHAANTLTRWYVEPLVERQNAFNAAVVHAVQALADALARVEAAQPALHQHIADLEQHVLDIDDLQTAMARRLASPPEHGS
ncbi:MAG: glycosyl transferase family 1 [Chloroflexi bacterium]|nr:glycosyl transferase family 1 [Chloroflexota bacterium]